MPSGGIGPFLALAAFRWRIFSMIFLVRCVRLVDDPNDNGHPMHDLGSRQSKEAKLKRGDVLQLLLLSDGISFHYHIIENAYSRFVT